MLKKALLLMVALLSISATAFAWTETWYIWQCVNCKYVVETNYNQAPSTYMGAGATACPYDELKGHFFQCVGTKQIEKR